MRIGPLRDRLTLIPPAGLNEYGEPITGDGVSVWAEVQDIRADDRATATGILAEATVKARLRWRSDIAADWQADYRGQRYSVVGLEGGTRRAWLFVYLKRV